MDREIANRQSLAQSREEAAYAEGFRDARKHWKKKLKKLRRKLKSVKISI